MQKEQESRVAMELQVTEVEERLDQVTSELSMAQQERERLTELLEQEKSQSKVSKKGGKRGWCWTLHYWSLLTLLMCVK